MSNTIKTSSLFSSVPTYLASFFENCTYPWELLPKIKDFAASLIIDGIDGFTLWSDGILVGENVTVHPSAVILPPAIIGSGTEIRPGAYLRGSVIIGRNCVVGNSTEIKNSILLDGAQVPHYNYVGDSVLGNKAHMGAGAVCSNLKADGSSVVIHGDREYPTGLRKVGAFIGDGGDIGCGCILNPGTVVGRNTSVYPLTALRGVYPDDSIVKTAAVVVSRRA